MKAAVLGAGTMGTGIAYALAGAGYETQIVDIDMDRPRAAITEIERLVAKAVANGRLHADDAPRIAGRLRGAAFTEIEPHSDVIVEAVPEDIEMKLAVLARAEATEPTLLASNTSSISIGTLAARLRRPERFLGLHFFNPVWSMPLVEIVVGEGTSAAAVAGAQSIARALGKEPLVVNDSPGFVTSRLGVALGLEAMRMLQDGVAPPEVIDRAMVLGYAHPMGPLRLTDLVGLDVRLDIAQELAASLGERFAPPAVLVDKVAAGHLGKKSGRGFYTWEP